MSLAVENNRLVTLWVRMADMTGKTLEESPEEGLTYWHGHGDIFPKIEAALEGRFPGEGFTIHLEPHAAYGEYDCDRDDGRRQSRRPRNGSARPRL